MTSSHKDHRSRASNTTPLIRAINSLNSNKTNTSHTYDSYYGRANVSQINRNRTKNPTQSFIYLRGRIEPEQEVKMKPSLMHVLEEVPTC